MVSEGSWERDEGKTVEKSINVAPKIILQIPTSIKAGAEYLISGQVLPAALGIKLSVIQDGKKLGSFITDSVGGFTFNISPSSPGIHTYLAKVEEGDKNSAGSSEIFTVLVR